MKNYDIPKQVKFIETGTGEKEPRPLCGIAFNDIIICGECGGIIPVDECEIIKEFSYWVDFSDFIDD